MSTLLLHILNSAYLPGRQNGNRPAGGMWRLDDELNLHKTARFWLGTYEQQAQELGCEPLTEAIVFARAQADSVIARLEREVAEAEEAAAG